MYFYRLPKVLVISINRFVYNESFMFSNARKIKTYVDFPSENKLLDLKKYVLNDSKDN